MPVIRDLTDASMALRVLLAILLGGILGMERGMKHRPAGMRTYMLVCLGASIVMMTNQYIYQVFQTGDPVRMGAQVVSGIGFLGAGTIVVTRRNQIKGLTTAVGLWASACVGLAVGIGLYEVALIGGVGIFLILTLLHELDDYLRRKTKQMEVYVELKEGVSVRHFLQMARQNGMQTSNPVLQIDHAEGVAFTVTLKGQQRRSHDEVIQMLRAMEGVAYLEEL